MVEAVAEEQSTPPQLFTLEQLYRDHKQFVFSTAFRYCGGRRDAAEDVTQAVFIKANRHLDRLDPGLDPRSWLFTVAANEAMSYLRSESRWHRRTLRFLTARDQEKPPTPDQTVSTEERAQLAWQTIARLRAPDRVVAALALAEEMPQSRIAELLGLSEATVSRILKRVKKHLRAQGWSS